MADLPQDTEPPKRFQPMPEYFVAQIPKALWPIYEEGNESGDDCDSPRFIVEYEYGIIDALGDPMGTSLGLDYFPEGSERPSFAKGQAITLNSVDVLVVSVEESEEVSEETGKPITWFAVEIDLPKDSKESKRG